MSRISAKNRPPTLSNAGNALATFILLDWKEWKFFAISESEKHAENRRDVQFIVLKNYGFYCVKC